MKRVSLLLVAVLGLSLVARAAEEKKIKLDGVKCVVAANKPAKAENAVEYKTGKVFFCCGNCPKAFSADTAKFATRANQQLVATGQAVQSTCPLTGGELDAGTAITVGGAKIAFCCNNCKGKAEKLKGSEQAEFLFNDAAFEKAGFKVGAKE